MSDPLLAAMQRVQQLESELAALSTQMSYFRGQLSVLQAQRGLAFDEPMYKPDAPPPAPDKPGFLVYRKPLPDNPNTKVVIAPGVYIDHDSTPVVLVERVLTLTGETWIFAKWDKDEIRWVSASTEFFHYAGELPSSAGRYVHIPLAHVTWGTSGILKIHPYHVGALTPPYFREPLGTKNYRLMVWVDDNTSADYPLLTGGRSKGWVASRGRVGEP